MYGPRSALLVQNRTLVLDLVAKNPGAHLRELARRGPAALGTTLYHLDRLERAGKIVVRRDGRYKRYFTADAFDAKEKTLLSAMRHHVPCDVVADLLVLREATQRELGRRVGVSRSTISFHTTQLVAAGILLRDSTRPEGLYSLIDPTLAARTLDRFSASLRGHTTGRDPAAPTLDLADVVAEDDPMASAGGA